MIAVQCVVPKNIKYQIFHSREGGREEGSLKIPRGWGSTTSFFNFTVKKHTVGGETIHVQICYNYYNVIHIHVCLICYHRLEMRQPKADLDLW